MDTKNIFRKWFSAVGVLLLIAGMTGCVVEQDIESELDNNGKPILFSPKVNKNKNAAQSRAASGHPIESGDNIPSGGSFGVYAYSRITAGGRIEPYASLQNTKVTAGSSSFTYDPIAKWPAQSSAKLAFFSYYPWQEQNQAGSPVIDVTTGGTNSPSMAIAYTTPSDPAKQIDLMWARTGLMAGHDPVEMVFGHALTRINFKARVVDYTQQVKITEITVKNVFTKGTLTVPEENAPAWSGFHTAANMSLTAAMLADVQLSGTPVSVINAGADMLVIPQGVAGIEVHVKATMNDNPFPEPFVFPLATSPDWEMNKIVTYEITLGSDGVDVKTKVNDWEKNDVNIIYDKQWWMSVDKDELEFKFEGDSEAFTAETNYDPGSQFTAGLQITGTEIEYSSGVGVTGLFADEDWITLNLSDASSNSLSQTVTVTASKNGKSVERKAKIKVKAGNITKIINVTQEPGLPEIDSTRVEDTPQARSYVGAFWKKNQTGERVITIPVTSDNAGYWSVQVYYPGDFAGGDIQFSTAPSGDPDFGTNATADMNSKDASYRVLYGKEYATGKVADNGGAIFFRIGLESLWNSTANKPARYAVVVIGYKNNNKFQALYLRQGEDPDYLIYPGDDKYKTRTKQYMKKFLPYNLTAPKMSDADHTNVDTNQGVLVDYPSKAGAFFKWAGPTGEERWAWHPTKLTVSGYTNTYTSGAWTSKNETCPSGYRRPKAAGLSAETTSEFAMSLLFDPTENNLKNSVWGYYADGFFDRRTIGPSTTGHSNTVVNSNSYQAAYLGRLFYNNISGSKRRGASIFFPAPGSRDFNGGNLERAGYYGFYISSSPYKTSPDQVYDFQIAETDVKYAHMGFVRARAVSIRCVVDE
jgi:hypothetical protein